MAKKDNYIMYEGERLDLSDWVLMSVKAAQLGNSEGFVRKLVFRTKRNEGKKTIIYREIPELNLTLVKR